MNKNLDLNKSHGHDIISVNVLKICNDSICKPVKLIFQFCLESEMVPLHEKGDKQYYKTTGQCH